MRLAILLALFAALSAEDAPKLDRLTLTNGSVLVGSVSDTPDGYAISMRSGDMRFLRDRVAKVERGVAAPRQLIKPQTAQSGRPIGTRIDPPALANPETDEQIRKRIEDLAFVMAATYAARLAAMPKPSEVSGTDTVDEARAKEARAADYGQYSALSNKADMAVSLLADVTRPGGAYSGALALLSQIAPPSRARN